MALVIPKALHFNPARLRSYLLRLPLFTRLTIVVITLFWIIGLQTLWGVVHWGQLKPSEMNLSSMYRINTFPLIHVGFLHALLNVLTLTPLLERFEAEHGTLTTIALFFGPFSTLPGGLYVLIEKFILRGDTGVAGGSIWVFLLLGVEAVKTFRMNPYFHVATYKIPTWVTPLVIAVLVAILISSSSFLGHLCGLAVGYGVGLGYLRFLFPPEKALRWIESKLNLLARVPHYVSVDQKIYGRYGVLPSGGAPAPVAMTMMGSTQRLGP